MKVTARVAQAGAVLGVATVLTLGGTAPPATATTTTCYGYTCHGHDPGRYGCVVTSTKVATVYQGTTPIATLENRYSYGCNANWAQAQLTSTAINWGYRITVCVDTTDSRGSFEQMCAPTAYPDSGALQEPPEPCGSSGPLSTDMVDGTDITTTTLTVFDSTCSLVAQARISQ